MKAGSRRSAASAPLRVAYLFQQFPVRTEVFAVSDIAALAAQGHRVTVYTMKGRPRREAELLKVCGVPGALPIDRPGLSDALRWPAAMWRWRGPAARLAGQILARSGRYPVAALQGLLCLPRAVAIADRVQRFDVVHAFWSRHVGLVLPLLAERRAKPVRTAFVGAYDLVADDLLVDLTVGAAEAVISHAEANQAYIQRKAPAGVPTQIIPRGIPLIPPSEEGTRDPFKCITASALVPSKNVEGVIRACAAARAVDPRVSLDIFGDGPDRQRLEQFSRLRGFDWVNFRGHVSREALFEEMEAASVFLLLSRKPSERLPNVVKEALWAGCAVISSNSEGIEELLPDASYGQIVDPGVPGAAESALQAALSETDGAARKRRTKARTLIEDRFSSDRNMGRYVEMWRRVLQGRRQVSRSTARRPAQSRRGLSRSVRREPQPR